MFYNNTPPPPASSDHGGRVVLCASQFSYWHTVTPNTSRKNQSLFLDKHICGNLNIVETQALVFFEKMWAGKPWRSVECFFENLEYEINTYQQDEMSFWILWVFGPLDIWKIEALEFWNFEACYWKNSSTPAHTDSHLCTSPPLFVWLCNPTGSELQWNSLLGARPSAGGRGCVEGMPRCGAALPDWSSHATGRHPRQSKMLRGRPHLDNPGCGLWWQAKETQRND